MSGTVPVVEDELLRRRAVTATVRTVGDLYELVDRCRGLGLSLDVPVCGALDGAAGLALTAESVLRVTNFHDAVRQGVEAQTKRATAGGPE